ncbi:hypothetical protein [Pandoravirus japonicus]|uniref:Uncharacterized protein n=1 Tax=Pandoravirus japonicus TaxID=2823154 RepID=A0A811BM07_9VIRU|nr:hypothetical protein [Pandoravirus japonicus]
MAAAVLSRGRCNGKAAALYCRGREGAHWSHVICGLESQCSRHSFLFWKKCRITGGCQKQEKAWGCPVLADRLTDD